MNPRIKTGWDYFWNLKPTEVSRMKNSVLIIQLHTWMKLIEEECKGQTKEEDLLKVAQEIFK